MKTLTANKSIFLAKVFASFSILLFCTPALAAGFDYSKAQNYQAQSTTEPVISSPQLPTGITPFKAPPDNPNETSNTASAKETNNTTGQVILVIWLVIVVLGAILGFTGKTTVFRNFNDLPIVFGIVIVSMIGAYMDNNMQLLRYAILALGGGLLLWIGARTFKDNSNTLLALVAFITKMTLSILIFPLLLEMVAPSGKNWQERSGHKRNAFMFLLVLTPLIYGLVRDKEGILNPLRVTRTGNY